MDFGLNCRLFTRPTTLPKVEILFRMDYLGGVGFLGVESRRTRTALIGRLKLSRLSNMILNLPPLRKFVSSGSRPVS